MKKILTFLFIIICLAGFSTNYYVSNSGSDSNTGLSDGQAWLTLTKVNAQTFAAGDSIFFKRGNSWYGQLVPDNGSAPATTTKIYCMGDSQTSGDYPPLLQTSLTSVYGIVDKGVGGEKTYQMVARFSTDITATQDDYVIIMGGTNDIFLSYTASTIKANLQTMYDAAHAMGAKVVAMTITPNNPTGYSATMIEVNNWIKAKPTNVDYVVDTYSVIEDPANPYHPLAAYTTDGTHYTAAGNQAILSEILKQVIFVLIDNPNKIYYGAYGSGNKPVIHKAVSLNSTSDWEDQGGNVWKTVQTFSPNVGNVIFNNEAFVGTPKFVSTTELTAQGYYYSNLSDSKLYLYSVGNPASYYSDIKACVSVFIVPIDGKQYITIENLAIKYTGVTGVGGSTSGTNNIVLRGLEVSYCGGQLFGSAANGYRYGNGIGFWQNVNNLIIANCKVWECFDAGITHQCTASYIADQYNIVIINNVIYNCEYNYEYFNRHTSSTSNNIRFENNTSYNAGGGWGHTKRPDPLGYNLKLAGNPPTTSNINVRNNILSEAQSVIVFVWGTTFNTINVDYNLIYQTSGNIANVNSSNYDTWSGYKTATTWDSNSINSDPLLTDAANYSFTLQLSSPAINSGYVTGLTMDYLSNTRDDSLDIGAYEYIAPTPPSSSFNIWSSGANWIMFGNQIIAY